MKPFVRHLAIILGYGLVAVALTYPLIGVGGDAIVGNRIAAKDGWQTVWDIWWWREGLRTQPAQPLQTHHIYWPSGVDLLAYRAYGLTSMLQGTPILWALGPVAAYKWNMLLNFALSGYAMFLLARHLTGAMWPSLAAGLLFTAAPFHLSRFADGYHDLTALQWLPFYLLPLTLWLERGKLRHGFVALLALTALLLASSYYTQFALVWTAVAAGVWGLASLVGQGSGVRGQGSGIKTLASSLVPPMRAALLLAAWGLVCFPLIQRLGGASIGYNDFLLRQELHSVDLLDLVLPSDIHPLWSRFDPHQLTHPYGSWNVVPGIALLALGCIGLYGAWRRLWRWALLGGAMLLFAMGPTLLVGGRAVPWPLPMPHDALNLFAVGRASQRPNHFLILTILVLCIGVAALLMRVRARTGLLLVVAALLIDCLPPLPWPPLPAPPPTWEASLATLGEGAVIELPYRPREIDYQITQMRHTRPIIGGYVSRVPPYPLNNHPVLRRLSGTDVETIADSDIPRETHAFAAALCARALVLHPEYTARDAQTHQARIAAQLPQAVPLSTNGALVYALDGPGTPAPLVVLNEGWYDLERDGERRWQWSEPRATIDLINPRAAPMLVRLDLTAYAAASDQPARLLLDGAPFWSATISTASTAYTFFLRLPSQGSVELTLDSTGPRIGRPLGLALNALRATALEGQELPCPVIIPLVPGL